MYREHLFCLISMQEISIWASIFKHLNRLPNRSTPRRVGERIKCRTDMYAHVYRKIEEKHAEQMDREWCVL